MNPDTKAIRDQMERTSYREHSSPIFMTSSFVYHSAEHAEEMFAGNEAGDIYSRFTNPNTTELISKYRNLEEGEAGVCTSSGMAAVFACLSALLNSGDKIIACEGLFGNSNFILEHILPNWGIQTEFIPCNEWEKWKLAISQKPKMVFIETPTNPGLDLIDLQEMSALCKEHEVIFCVDNCFATPILQKPLTLGADISLHSATKWIDGQGRSLGGIIIGKQELVDVIFDFLRRTGACLSPFNAWLLSKSTETLQIRMERHCENALALARYLEKHQKVESLRYPHLPSHPQYDLALRQMVMGGGIVTFALSDEKVRTFQFINHLTIPSITANLGDSRTIVTHPSTTTHCKLSDQQKRRVGIHNGTIRVSVGLESIDDIIEDFEQAFSKLK